jgi:hypothetical protein
MARVWTVVFCDGRDSTSTAGGKRGDRILLRLEKNCDILLDWRSETKQAAILFGTEKQCFLTVRVEYQYILL